MDPLGLARGCHHVIPSSSPRHPCRWRSHLGTAPLGKKLIASTPQPGSRDAVFFGPFLGNIFTGNAKKSVVVRIWLPTIFRGALYFPINVPIVQFWSILAPQSLALKVIIEVGQVALGEPGKKHGKNWAVIVLYQAINHPTSRFPSTRPCQIQASPGDISRPLVEPDSHFK